MKRILIQNGTLYDGLGGQPYQADLLVQDDRIAQIAPGITEPADQVIDATGKAVTPGFVDIHRHHDAKPLNDPHFGEVELAQGITTAVAGNCGISMTPRPESDEAAKEYYSFEEAVMGPIGLDGPHTYRDYLAALHKTALPLNVAAMIGTGTVKICVKGFADTPYTQQELDASGLFKRSQSGRIYCLFWKRVMTPIFDLRGNIIAFGGRVMDDSKPKYVNSPETLVYHKSETVFAMQIAKRSASRRFVLCEGYMDVISMQQAGIDTAVCACGTALTPGQVRIISEYADEVILSYDSDEAGQKATLRSLELFRNSPVKVGVLQIPGAKDPDEYIKKYGPERFQALLDGVGNALDFRLKRLRDQYNLSQDAQRLQYVKEAVEMLADRSNPTEQEVYAGRLAEETNISKTAILAQLGTAAKRAGGKYRREKNRELLRSGEMDQIKVPYSAGGSQALGIASAQQRLLAAILREPRYLELAKQQLTAEQFIQPQQKELYEAMLNCSREGVELSLTALRAFVSEEALNELSRLAAQYSDVNCTPDDIRLYLDRIARGMPVASKAAAMSGDEITQYLQSMREKKQGTLPEQD